MIIVSFGTQDGVYDKYLERLQSTCEAHGHRCDMEFTSPSSPMTAFLRKPSFIRDMLHKHGETILWLDADAVVAKPISLPVVGWDVGLARNTRWRDRKKNPTSGFAIAVNPTDAGHRFLRTWEYLCAKEELCRYGDHRRMTWTREMLEGEYRELRLEHEIPGSVIRDYGLKKQAVLR